jgi:transcriptional regulator with XRE-family HTH domain
MVPGIQRGFDLRTARLNAGHTVRSLAAELKIDQRTLARLEAGGVVHPANALRVADYFDVQVTDLMPVERSPA